MSKILIRQSVSEFLRSNFFLAKVSFLVFGKSFILWWAKVSFKVIPKFGIKIFKSLIHSYRFLVCLGVMCLVLDGVMLLVLGFLLNVQLNNCFQKI